MPVEEITTNMFDLSQYQTGLNSIKENSIEDSSIFLNDSENIEKIQTEEEPVTFSEGLSLVGEGFVNKIKSIGSAIAEHPFRTIATVVGVSSLVAMAPIIGVSSAVAGSVLALGFAGYAVFETAQDVVETVKDNKEGRYDEVREDLGEIGGDTVDLALSLPFVPKALSTVKNAVKYAPSVGINTSLINDLKSGKGIYASFKKADITINYETIANQMGIEVKPALDFVKFNTTSEGTAIGGAYEPTTATMQLNEEYLTLKGNLKLSLSNADSSTVIGHELTHYQQFCEIARTYGTDGLESLLTKYYEEALKKVGNGCDIDITQASAELDAARKEAWSALKQQINNLDDSAITDNLATANIKYETAIKHYEEVYQAYENALNNLSAKGLDRSIVDNMLNGDKTVFNSEFYQKVIENAGTIEGGSEQALKANEYAAALIEKVTGNEEVQAQILKKYNLENMSFAEAYFRKTDIIKASNEIYKQNLLESEAYQAQSAYSYPVYAANEVTTGITALSEASDEINTYEDDITLKQYSSGYINEKSIVGIIKKIKSAAVNS